MRYTNSVCHARLACVCIQIESNKYREREWESESVPSHNRHTVSRHVDNFHFEGIYFVLVRCTSFFFFRFLPLFCFVCAAFFLAVCVSVSLVLLIRLSLSVHQQSVHNFMPRTLTFHSNIDRKQSYTKKCLQIERRKTLHFHMQMWCVCCVRRKIVYNRLMFFTTQFSAMDNCLSKHVSICLFRCFLNIKKNQHRKNERRHWITEGKSLGKKIKNIFIFTTTYKQFKNIWNIFND